MDELLVQCRDVSRVFLYGASVHGSTVNKYLKSHGIKVTSFVVSRQDGQAAFLDGVPICEFKDVTWSEKDYIVLLSLSERFHAEIIHNLKAAGAASDHIQPLTHQKLNDMFVFLINKQRKDILCQEISKEKTFLREHYDAQITEMLTAFDNVIIKNMDVRGMGPMGTWKFYCEEQKSDSKQRIYHLYYPVTSGKPFRTPNDFLLSKMTGKGISVVTQDTVNFWRYFISKCPEVFTWDMNFYGAGWNSTANYNYQASAAPLIHLNADDEQRGAEQAKALGLLSEYICFSCRDSGYIIDKNGYAPTERFIGSFRNADIENYRLSMSYLKQQGIQAVRMGAMVKKSFQASNAVDYAMQGYSGFMDVYLTAHCKFFVCNLSGITVFPMLLAKPILIVNAALLTTKCDTIPCFSPNRDFAILKKFWDKKTKKYLTLKKILSYEIAGSKHDQVFPNGIFQAYLNDEIEVVENTQEEIYSAIQEMNERINGTYVDTSEDIALYDKYKKIVHSIDFGDHVLSGWRLCAGYLRNNKWLLD